MCNRHWLQRVPSNPKKKGIGGGGTQQGKKGKKKDCVPNRSYFILEDR